VNYFTPTKKKENKMEAQILLTIVILALGGIALVFYREFLDRIVYRGK
jgi:hypothetical protein